MSVLALACIAGCDPEIFSTQPEHFYIDPEDGDDMRRGTSPNKAWKTFGRISGLELGEGKVLYLRGGNTIKGTLKLKDISATPEKPLTITAYGEGRANIDAGDSSGILIENCKNIVIKNINIIGSGRLNGNAGSGLVLKFVEHGDVDSVDVSGFVWNGVQVTGGSKISITHVFSHDNGFAGISVDPGKDHIFKDGKEYKTMKGLYIGYCVAENNPGCPLVTDNHSGSGILISGVTGGVIEYCEAMNNGWDMPRPGNGPVGIWAYMCDSIIIQQCYSHRNKTSASGKDGGGFDFDGGMTNSIMQYNHSAWNEGGGYGLFQYGSAAEWSNNVIRYNTSLNDGAKNSRAGIHIWSDPEAVPMKNCMVYNNIIINNQKFGVRFEDGSYENFVFESNIFTLTADSENFISGEFAGAWFNNNQYWSFYRSTRNLPQPKVRYDQNPIFSEPSMDFPMLGN
jgi:hypothetical protein